VPPVIEVQGLVKRFGAFTSVDDLSLEVNEGEVFGLLGSNGAGKSTTIRMLCGLLRPSAGSARVLGIDVARDPEGVKKRIGYMTQRFSLYDDITVRQNIRFFGGVYGLRGRARQEREAWAVLHDPKVVFLDEPTGGVDPISRRRFWRLIDEMAARGVTLIVTTHYLDEAERCDRIALLHAARLVALGTVATLKDVFAGRVLLEVDCPRVLEAQEALEKEVRTLEVSVFGDRLHVVVEDLEAGKRLVQECLARHGNVPVSVERIVPSLEDVFIHCIEAEDAARAARGRVT
jgi:ABC-2 type transport system ATP-binding protein